MFPNELEEEWGCEREEEREFLAVKLERGAVRTFELLSEYYSYFIRRGRWEWKILSALRGCPRISVSQFDSE